jgi:hypothetical protein
MAEIKKKHTIYKNKYSEYASIIHNNRTYQLSRSQTNTGLGSAWIPPGMQQPQTYMLSRSQRNTARVSMDSSWHAAATDLHAVKESEKYSQGQHGFHQACSSHRLTYCQGVREIQPGSAWIPPGMQQPQTYKLSRSQRNTARVSMDSTWHAAATDLQTVKESEKYSQGQHGFHLACSSHRLTPVKESEKYSQGQHGFHLACSSHRLTPCQGVREIQPGSAWSPPGMQQPQTYICQGVREI